MFCRYYIQIQKIYLDEWISEQARFIFWWLSSERGKEVHTDSAQIWMCQNVYIRKAAVSAYEGKIESAPMPTQGKTSMNFPIARSSPKFGAFSVFSRVWMYSLVTALDFPPSPAQESLHLPPSVEEGQVMPLAHQGWAGPVSDTSQMLHPEPVCSSPGNTSPSKNHHARSSCCTACHCSRHVLSHVQMHTKQDPCTWLIGS